MHYLAMYLSKFGQRFPSVRNAIGFLKEVLFGFTVPREAVPYFFVLPGHAKMAKPRVPKYVIWIRVEQTKNDLNWLDHFLVYGFLIGRLPT